MFSGTTVRPWNIYPPLSTQQVVRLNDFTDKCVGLIAAGDSIVVKSALAYYNQVAEKTAALVGSGTLAIAKFFERGTPHTAEDISALKDMWRSADARRLLSLDGDFDEAKMLVADVSEHAQSQQVELQSILDNLAEKLADVTRASKLLGLAQAMHKTLKADETRKALIENVLEGCHADGVNLSDDTIRLAKEIANS